jgi:hypothetical protein
MASMLGYSATDLCSIPQLFFVFNHHIYDGYGDCNISFAFRSLDLSVVFIILLTFKKGRTQLINVKGSGQTDNE